MDKKTCFKCQIEQPVEEFYKNPGMIGGRVNKCRTCTKQAVRENYYKQHGYYTRYERERNQRPARKAQQLASMRRGRVRNPLKYKARTAVNNAVRDGRLKRLPCQKCGAKEVQAHHTDYSKPLDVVWLCEWCHMGVEHGAWKQRAA